MLTLYKFRSLGDCQSLCRAEKILETGQLWCSRFWEMNDPMEGVYQFTAGSLEESAIKELYQEKQRRVICSFSGKRAFHKPVMWGYYANGFKGIAIEIEVDRELVEKVEYQKSVSDFNDTNDSDERVKRILTTKLNCWTHEHEFRFIANGNGPGLRNIGTITGVYFGVPYITTVNAQDAQRRRVVRDYLRRRRCLAECARGLNIDCYDVKIDNGKVVSQPMSQKSA